MSSVVYWGASWYSKFILLPVYARIRTVGIENVPAEGPLVIASNHLSDTDVGVLCARLPRRVVFMAKAELYRVPLLAQFLRAYRTIPVRRNRADLSALRHASETLKE